MKSQGGVVRQVPEAARIHLPTLNALAVGAFGFSLQGNLFLPSLHLPFVRLSDMLALLLVPYFFLRALPEVRLRVLRGALFFAPVILATLLFKSHDGGESLLYIPLMYFIYFLLAGLLLLQFLDDPDMLSLFCWAQLAGFCLAIAALLLSSSSGPLLETVGLKVPMTAMADERSQMASLAKLGGLWAAGNEAGNVFAIAGAAALYLAIKQGRLLIYFAYMALMLVSFAFTANRAGLIAPLIGMAVLIVVSGWRGWISVAACALLTVALGFAVFPDLATHLADQIAKRTVDDTYSSENAHGRTEALRVGAQLMLNHPLGVFYTQRMREFIEMTGGLLQSPHNLFLSLAYQIGIAGPVLLILGYGNALAFKPPVAEGPRTYLRYMALVALPSMFFEELDPNPAFQLVITSLIVALVCRPLRKDTLMSVGRRDRSGLGRTGRAEPHPQSVAASPPASFHRFSL
jgi:hypothetical protein